MTDLEIAEQMVDAADALLELALKMKAEAEELRDTLYAAKYPGPDMFEAMGFPPIGPFPSVRCCSPTPSLNWPRPCSNPRTRSRPSSADATPRLRPRAGGRTPTPTPTSETSWTRFARFSQRMDW